MKNFIETNLPKIRFSREVMDNVLSRARKAKAWINNLFGIDPEVGYRKIETSINKVELLQKFLDDNRYRLESMFRVIVREKLRTDNFYINDVKAKDKNLISVECYVPQNRNKHLWSIKNVEIKATELDGHDVYKILHDYYLVSEINSALAHKVICECKSTVEIYIVTSSIAMLFAAESDHFGSCHSIGNSHKYANGNLQNLLSKNVFAVYRLKRDEELLSRAWVYTKKFSEDNITFYISRIYNNGRLTGRHIVNALQSLDNRINVKRFTKTTMDMVDYYGYNDINNEREVVILSTAEPGYGYFPIEEIYFPLPVDLQKGFEYAGKSDNYLCQYTEVCHSCGQPILEDEDYIVTTEGEYFHENCDGYSYCDFCEDYHLADIDWYEVTSRKGNILYYCEYNVHANTFYCDCCQTLYDRNYYDDYAVKIGREDEIVVCESCSDDIAIYCGDCGNYYDAERVNYMEKDDGGYVCEFCMEHYSECDECHSLVDKLYVSNFGNICKDCLQTISEYKKLA